MKDYIVDILGSEAAAALLCARTTDSKRDEKSLREIAAERITTINAINGVLPE